VKFVSTGDYLAVLVPAVVVFLTSAAAYLKGRTNAKEIAANTAITVDTSDKLDEVHTLVNSRLSTSLNRIEQLVGALVESGTKVPPAN